MLHRLAEWTLFRKLRERLGLHRVRMAGCGAAPVAPEVLEFFLALGVPIHALSAWTMIGLPFGVAAIRRRDVKKHRHTMTGMFVGAIVIAGLFSFLPGRLMWEIFFTA